MTTAIGATTIEITPLMLACQNGNLEDVKSMLAKGASVEAKDSNNRTAIFYCAENVELDCIEELLKHKADVNHQDKDGYSCLHLAVICGNQLIVEYLVEHGADINMTDSEMHSATHWSVVCGQEAILDYLLAHNADPETADIHGAYPIHYAAQMCGHIDVWDESINRDSTKSLIILRKLIQQKVKIDAEDFDQRNAIIWAASSGSSEALLELFLAGGDPNKHEKDGLTALHCASSRNHLECIRVLIEECKTSVDIMDNNNCTPIFYAATLGQLDACHLLIKYGANLHVQDCKGRTVYHCAAAKGQLRCLKSLCKQNPTIWLRNRRGDYPIHEAYYNRQMECVYYLLDAIADKQAPHASNMYDGRTLLHLAAADNDLKLCKRLVGGDGCDVNCLMKTSPTTYMTPYDVAIIKKSAECARYLKSLGGLSGTEVVSKLQQSAKPAKQKNQGDSVLKKNSKSKANTSSSSNDSKVMEARRERLKSIERTTFNEQISGDKSNKNENNSKTKNSNEEHDNNIEYTETEESGGGGAANGRGRGEETSDETETNQEETKKSVTTKVEQKQSQQQNKKPIMEQRQMNKSMITESSERQKKRDAVLAAQMAQAQAERERRRKQQQQQQKEQEERDKQKMSNLNSMYTQVKSKSTVSRGARDKSGRPQQKDSIVSKKQNQSQERTNTNKDSSFLPTLINNGERDKKRNNQEKKETTRGAGKKTESDEATTTTTTMNGNKDAAPEKEDEGVIKSKYNRYVSDDEEDENDDDVDNWYVRKRSEGMALPVREPTKQTLKGRRKEKSFVNNKSTSKKKDDYDDDDDEEEFKNIQDNSDNTSLTNEKTPRKSEVGSKASRKRNLELPSPNRQSRHQTKSKVLVGDSVATTSNPDDENMVRLIIKNDQISGDSSLARKRYASLFDKQRLVLKSLYEIRRCRINNRDIIVSSDLNNMLIKSYDYDIRKNCRSLRDLEKMLEIIAVEISDEYRKNNKRSQTLLTFKPKPANNLWRSTDNIARSEKRLNDEKSKSQMADSSPMAESLRFRQERIQAQNDHLKVAYRPLLPNDIYKQYYHTNSKYTAQKEQPERKEKSIILPVISQKPSFTI